MGITMKDLLTHFHAPISAEIWQNKYRFVDKFTNEIFDETVEDTWRRVASALAEPEESNGPLKAGSMSSPEYWTQEFYDALSDFKFLPAGRILAGAGTARRVTLFNCYVMGTIPDSMDGIFSSLREAALTMQQGGGIGYDFSTIRPKNAQVKQVAADASGPLSFMDVWDAMCRTVMSAGSRRGAMMATMRCDHPDIEAFIGAKADPNRLRMFNMSVLVTDAFMAAVKNRKNWDLTFGGKVYKTVWAPNLWRTIMESTYAHAEPGVIFIDRINQENNLKYMETISATNPCGEQPLPPYGACLLGSINLARLVKNPYQTSSGVDIAELRKLVSVAIRMMDNVNDVSLFPLEEQLAEAKAKRRVGLGVTGLADALLMCGLRYGSDEAAERAETWMRMIALAAYEASIDLAREKGPFPALDRAQYLNSGQFADLKLPGTMKQDIMKYGIRNALLLSIAPTGTISLYAGNVSSGIEPIFAPSFTRKTLQDDGSKKEQLVVDYAVSVWEDMNRGMVKDNRELTGEPTQALPPAYVDAQSLTPAEHVKMQAAVQKWVDTSISKTINVPEDISFEDFKAVYEMAFDNGLKGCTTYRPNEVTGSVISVEKPKGESETTVKSTPHNNDLLKAEANLLMDEARRYAETEDHRKELRKKLTELGVSKVKDLTGPLHVEKAHKLYNWLVEQQEPNGESETTSRGPMLVVETNPSNDKSWVENIFRDEPEGDPYKQFAEDLAKAENAPPGGNVVVDEKPQERGFVLDGSTYKIKLGDSAAVYVTITDVETEEGMRPFEVFIATKDPAHQQWTTALTLMISAVFRRPHNSRFVVEELKSVFDPKGGGFWHGKYWNSTVAAIGRVIEVHMERIGYINRPEVPWELVEKGRLTHDHPNPQSFPRDRAEDFVFASTRGDAKIEVAKRTCPKCYSTNLRHESGCLTCNDCGHSKCG
jgi:ribonucleoside-diphosphate reductase alpha chain